MTTNKEWESFKVFKIPSSIKDEKNLSTMIQLQKSKDIGVHEFNLRIQRPNKQPRTVTIKGLGKLLHIQLVHICCHVTNVPVEGEDA